jgi:hypothetical protein
MRACGTHGGRRGEHTGFWWESPKEKDHYENLDLYGRILLRLIIEKSYGVVWTGFIWLRIGSS